MSRRPDWLAPRKALPKAVQLEIFDRSRGICEASDCDNAGKEIDHIIPQACGGSNEPENLQLLCRHHHQKKTADDLQRIAKADRQGRRSGRQKEGRRKQKIQSRGFNKSWRKRMDGTVERRS